MKRPSFIGQKNSFSFSYTPDYSENPCTHLLIKRSHLDVGQASRLPVIRASLPGASETAETFASSAPFA